MQPVLVAAGAGALAGFVSSALWPIGIVLSAILAVGIFRNAPAETRLAAAGASLAVAGLTGSAIGARVIWAAANDTGVRLGPGTTEALLGDIAVTLIGVIALGIWFSRSSTRKGSS